MKKGKAKGGKKSGNPKSSNQWEDHYTRKARAENYPARSIYKLEEIQNKFNVIKKGNTVLDLGCAPGSWLLYAAKQAGPQGKIFGIDLKEVEIDLPDNATAVAGDIFELEQLEVAEQIQQADCVVSDMAPATTGRKDVDAARSFDLCMMALTTALKILKPGGNFVCKIFQGNDFNGFQKNVKSSFANTKVFKPESCRKQSKEIYIIAKGKK